MKSNALEFILNRFAFKAELGASLIKLMSVFYFAFEAEFQIYL